MADSPVANSEPSTTPPLPSHWRSVLGWVAVWLNTVVAGLWAFWGSIEAFHEGWRSETLLLNVLFVGLYLSFAGIAVTLGLLGLRFPRSGGVIVLLIGSTFAVWFLGMQNLSDAPPLNIVIGVAMAGFGGVLGLLWWFGRPRRKRLAYTVTWGVPLVVACVCGAQPAWRVATRIDDTGDRSAQVITSNTGRTLVWAPQGPGWPTDRGYTWQEAMDICARLEADGRSLADTPQNIWRLPTIEEYVTSAMLHGENAGGTWEASTGTAQYERQPDKEVPLWNPQSQIIYWWTSTEVGKDKAYRVVYHGGVYAKPKVLGMGSGAFRAVRDATVADETGG
ncbi:MAG: DUF1566 domain-containing protein [Planctomycetes bacterium]|nr:DUF1566 domain-containing protein [Planctomycetota bacterium]NOG54286.1 DUF1566 domain-containing protein [Planctomycetota bacterium]